MSNLLGPRDENGIPLPMSVDESIASMKASLLKKIKRSAYVYRVDCGGCNGCEIEIFATLSPLFDAERFGIKVVPSPRHADILLFTGAVTRAMRSPALRAWQSAPDPKICISYGACGNSGGIFHAPVTGHHYHVRNFLGCGDLLLDSGAQYLDGTTDITRTIALGKLTEEEKTDYTLILKGHIDLAMAVFPEGTRGAQLDVLARMPIWQYHMNFLHGTGHGVGHFLNVHEGPQSIRMNENPVTLRPGMVTSNEPGVYKAGSHGIRTENLVLTVKDGEGMFGNYLKFETITLCPICKKGIIKEMLTAEETAWLDNYHQHVYEALSPSLNEGEREWLKEACSNLTTNH